MSTELGIPNIFVATLGNHHIVEFHNRRNPFRLVRVIDASDPRNHRMLSEADMILFLAPDEISKAMRTRIRELGEPWCCRIAMSNKPHPNLVSACTNYMQVPDYRTAHHFIDRLFDHNEVPGGVQHDYADLKCTFTQSAWVRLKTYTGPANRLIRKAQEIPEMDTCLMVIRCPVDVRLETINRILASVSPKVHMAQHVIHHKGPMELTVCGGYKMDVGEGDEPIDFGDYIEVVCDFCGAEATTIVFPEEGYPAKADLCRDCSKAFFNPELMQLNELHFFRK